MPTYDYECSGCNQTYEVFQAMTAAPLTECPHCHAASVKRLIGKGAGLIFKGSGFYCTDYKSTSSKADERVDRAKAASADVKASCGNGACAAPAATPAPASSTPSSS